MKKVKIKAVETKAEFKNNSALIKYFWNLDNLKSDLSEFLDEYGFQLTKFQKTNFIGDKTDEVKFYNSEKPEVVILRKIKMEDDFDADYFRNSLSLLYSQLTEENLEAAHLLLPDYKAFEIYFDSKEYFIQSVAEGIYLGSYDFEKYKTEKKDNKRIEVYFHSDDTKIANTAVDKAKKLLEAVFFTRDLVNEPAMDMTPDKLAKTTKKELEKNNITVEVLDHKEIHREGMKAIEAVAMGSKNKPRFISAHYKPEKKAQKKIALVGKGITYDSGGYSIKPTSNMREMKADMAGGAAVIGTVLAAAKLKLPIEIYGIVPAVENMVSGNAYRPGDVIGSMSGKTIEVRDTDAEGRIILADGLHYASKLKPDQIIDLATLTGSVVVALGELAAGVFTNYSEISDGLEKSGAKTNERVWKLPFWKEYKKLMKGDIADVKNLGPRWGGSITAGKFLEYFVDEKIPWAHLDIAGVALKNDSFNYTKKYDTGFGVRLLVDYLERIKDNG